MLKYTKSSLAIYSHIISIIIWREKKGYPRKFLEDINLTNGMIHLISDDIVSVEEFLDVCDDLGFSHKVVKSHVDDSYSILVGYSETFLESIARKYDIQR